MSGPFALFRVYETGILRTSDRPPTLPCHPRDRRPPEGSGGVSTVPTVRPELGEGVGVVGGRNWVLGAGVGTRVDVHPSDTRGGPVSHRPQGCGPHRRRTGHREDREWVPPTKERDAGGWGAVPSRPRPLHHTPRRGGFWGARAHDVSGADTGGSHRQSWHRGDWECRQKHPTVLALFPVCLLRPKSSFSRPPPGSLGYWEFRGGSPVT